MRHHLRAVMAYAQQERYRELMEYLQEYASVMTKEEKNSLLLQKYGSRCGHPFLCR